MPKPRADTHISGPAQTLRQTTLKFSVVANPRRHIAKGVSSTHQPRRNDSDDVSERAPRAGPSAPRQSSSQLNKPRRSVVAFDPSQTGSRDEQQVGLRRKAIGDPDNGVPRKRPRVSAGPSGMVDSSLEGRTGDATVSGPRLRMQDPRLRRDHRLQRSRKHHSPLMERQGGTCLRRDLIGKALVAPLPFSTCPLGATSRLRLL
ncbi:hypothetical protein C8R46DRAFT_459427 [Mycena filopes]|nr:hypothetical protein C8R46DRAFT_459427 [Mycena filopes]